MVVPSLSAGTRAIGRSEEQLGQAELDIYDGLISESHMAQSPVQFIIGQLLTDEELRDGFLDRPVERELVESGKPRPAIDRTHLLDETAAALSYLETGHAREGRHHHLTGDYASGAALVDVLLCSARHD